MQTTVYVLLYFRRVQIVSDTMAEESTTPLMDSRAITAQVAVDRDPIKQYLVRTISPFLIFFLYFFYVFNEPTDGSLNSTPYGAR